MVARKKNTTLDSSSSMLILRRMKTQKLLQSRFLYATAQRLQPDEILLYITVLEEDSRV